MNSSHASQVLGPVLALFLMGGNACATDPTPAPEKIDWPSFMRRHNMSFDKSPRNWREAPHFGNAVIGSMLYQTGDTIKLEVFRADVHDHRDECPGAGPPTAGPAW